MKRRILGCLILFYFLALGSFNVLAQSTISHAIAITGKPKYPADFTHFDYVNPNAPKGGTMKRAAVGTFDSFNPFISKGLPAAGISLLYDSLTVSSDDEPFTHYGLIAQKIELAPDRSWVVFHLNPKARFHDGKKVTSADVVFSFNTLMTKGVPSYKKYYQDVKKVEALSESKVKFSFKTTKNTELPLIIGQLDILPKHYWKNRDFNSTKLDPPLGSGPYKIKSFKPGQRIVLERVKNYWAKDLPVNKGSYNFDYLDFEYFRDRTVALEAFKAGELDFNMEGSAKNWATMYTGKFFRKGLIKKEEIENKLIRGMQGFIYNIRRSVFKDRKVREALAYAFDFEWMNKNIFYNQYKRTNSYFANSELASSGLPKGKELKLLEKYRSQLPKEVFTKEYKAPVTRGDGNIRKNLRQALRLLKSAGWRIKNGQLTNVKTGKIFKFEILIASPSSKRVIIPLIRNLKKLGIKVVPRLVDTSQYYQRLRNFNYDMIIGSFRQSLAPGNEQRYMWGSDAADIKGSRNRIGIKSPVVDDLVEKIITAPNREDLITATRALDRVLLWGHYLIPQYHVSFFRVAYWDKFHRPKKTSGHGIGFFSWWIDTKREAEINHKKRG